MLRLRHIYKTYQSDRHVLRDLNFETTASGLYFIKGQSGSGKTTLFKLLTAITKPTSGEVTFKKWNISKLNHHEITNFRKNIGIIFQDYKLIADLTIYENIILPLKIQKKTTSDISRLADIVVQKLGIGDYLGEYPEYISGGQQQKAALARALINRPELIIADEPTGNLDPKNSLEMIHILSEYASSGAIVLIATHDQTILTQYPSQTLTLEKGQLIK